VHIYNLRKNTQFCIDLRKFTCYNKTTVKTSTADKQSSRQNRQQVQIDLVQWRLAFLHAIFENSHALQLNCNMFRQKSQQYYARKEGDDLVLSESFKLARTAKNLTQTELAKLIGCTKQTISDIERGYRPPSAKIVKAMAECTGCSADEILGVEKRGEDENERNYSER
jgi:DNA-binding XRE family transcriptional regulator